MIVEHSSARHAVALATILAVHLLLGAPRPVDAALGSCGQPSSQGVSPVASDALQILRTAIGTAACGGRDMCICDVNADDTVTATDALLDLRAAVGQPVTLACDCGDTTPPTAPNGLTVTVVSPTRIDISWNAAVDDVAVAAYIVYGGSFWSKAAVGTSTSDTNPAPDTLYCYSVSALDTSGNESLQSDAVCVTTDPRPGDRWVTRLFGTEMDLGAVAWNGSRYVVMGDDSQVLHSSDTASWTAYEQPMLSPQGANDVVWSGSEFVAAKHWIYSSTDGISWSLRYLGSTEIQHIAWSNELGKYIAVGEDGYILSSSDADAWVTQTSGTSEWLNGVAWGNGMFVAVGDFGTILTSADGTAWNAITPVTDGSLNAVVWSGSNFVAVGMGAVLTSADGTTWNVEEYRPPDILTAVAWSADLGLFAAVGWNGAIVTSPDGTDWADLSIGSTFLGLRDVVWSGTEFVAVGDSGEIIASTDGATWTTVFSGADLANVVWTGNEFIAMGALGKIVTSADGITWSYGSTGDAWDYLFDLAFSPSNYAVGAQSFLLSSSDLVDWPDETWLGATSSCPGIVWDATRFVAVCTHGVVYTSGDGIDWSGQVLSGVSDLYDVVWTGSLYVAVGHGGTILSSEDATVWAPAVSNTVSRLRSVAWSGAQFVAVGDSGTVVTSPDGVAWTIRDSEVSNTLYNAIWTGSEFIAVGSSGKILRSSDAIAWSQTDHTYRTLRGVAWSGERLVVVGSDSTIVTLD